MPPSPPLRWPSPSSISSPAATSTAVTKFTQPPAWQPVVYLVVTLVIFAIIIGIILLIWNDNLVKLTCRRVQLELKRPDLAFLLSSPSTLINLMIRFFRTTLLPAFRQLGQTTTSLLNSSATSAETTNRPPTLPDPLDSGNSR